MNNNQIAKKFNFVTRQTLSTWEKGDSIPQIKKIEMLKKQGVNIERFILPSIKKLNSLLVSVESMPEDGSKK